MNQETKQLKKELEMWKERSKTKQYIINMLKIQNQAFRNLINLLSDENNPN